MSNLIENAKKLQKEFIAEARAIEKTPRSKIIEELRVRWLGKKGALNKLYDNLKSVEKADRPLAGKSINELKVTIETEVDRLKTMGIQFELEESLSKQPLDISLPASFAHNGSLHPVTLMRNLLVEAFQRLGFSVYDGPELDYDFYNFSALNIPEHHPARDMQDTFFLKNKSQLLRTHTSNIQIHAMLQEQPPLRLVAPGKVYRVDNDATHTPMFHQIECVVVDKGISFGHLKGVIDSFLKSVFGSDLKTRFRPSYFPFVEPGAEVDLQCTICRGKGCKVCSNTGWLEVGGSGMIHPNVFESVQYDSEVYTGFAFGFGIDRMAMLAYGLPDLRQMFLGDARYLSQFPIYR